MIINIEHKIIFLSNTKCASSALRQRFWHLRGEPPLHIEKDRVHSSYDEVKANLSIEYGLDIKNFYVFSTIRNPWERIVSLYNYAKPDKNGNEFWCGAPKNINKAWGGEYDKNTRCSFEEYLNTPCKVRKDVPYKFRYACRNLETMFGTGGLFFCYMDNIKIYKTEDLDINVILDDMSIFNNDVASQISREKLQIIEPNGWYPKKEGIESKNYREYYTNDSLIEIVANYYQTDIAYGGYVF